MIRYAVYHYETVPTDYIDTFSTVEEARVFREKYDFQDEWLIGEIDNEEDFNESDWY